MKIDDLNQNLAVSYPGNGRTDRSEAADHGETAAKPQTATDHVKLSSYMSLVSASEPRQDQSARVNQVAQIKTRVDNGSYQVSSRVVAEKMLAKFAGGASQPRTA